MKKTTKTKPSKNQCDNLCDNDTARWHVSVTNINGELVDEAWYCDDCMKDIQSVSSLQIGSTGK